MREATDDFDWAVHLNRMSAWLRPTYKALKAGKPSIYEARFCAREATRSSG